MVGIEVSAAGTGQETPSPVVGFLAAAALVSQIFWQFPEIDLGFSALFYRPGEGFPLAQAPMLVALREFSLPLPHVLLILFGLVLFLHVWKRHVRVLDWLPRPSCCLFVVAVMALGPGLLVRVLKDVIGRARPRDIMEFGGDASFSLPWQVSEACSDNCSFISGEGTAGAALMVLPLLLPRRWRTTGFAIIAPFAIAVSFNRVAFGAHFLSDVLIAWCLMLAMIALLWRVYRLHAARFDARISGVR